MLTAQKAREEPLRVPRPKSIEAAQEAARKRAEEARRQSDQPTVNKDGSIQVYGHRQMLQFMRTRGQGGR